MSTNNFIIQDNFDLYVYIYEFEKDIENNNDDTGLEIKNFNRILKFALTDIFKRKLNFFKITVKSGYYYGIQSYCKLLSENPYELNNEGCHYYWGVNRSTAIKKYNSEIRFINNKLLPYIRNNSSFERIIHLSSLNNGEAVYSYTI